MGLINWFRTQVTGVDIDATQHDLDTSDARLKSLNQEALRTGLYTQEIYDQADAHWQSGRILDAAGEVETAFTDSIKDSINTATATPLRLFWKSLPWWLILALLAGVLWYFGILQKLFARKAAA